MDFKVFFIKLFFSIPLSIIKFIDSFRDRKKGIVDLEDRFGIEAFVGLAGEGKTLSMVKTAYNYRKKYKDNILIFSNFRCDFADAQFVSYKQFLKPFKKSVLILYDEMPNDFNKNNHKEFPIDLFSKLTQLRKGNGVKILYSTQDIMLIDPDIRRLTRLVHECRTYKRRLTYFCTYDMQYYKMKHESISVDRKSKILKDSFTWFLQTNKLRNAYDSFLFLDNAKTSRRSLAERNESAFMQRSFAKILRPLYCDY